MNVYTTTTRWWVNSFECVQMLHLIPNDSATCEREWIEWLIVELIRLVVNNKVDRANKPDSEGNNKVLNPFPDVNSDEMLVGNSMGFFFVISIVWFFFVGFGLALFYLDFGNEPLMTDFHWLLRFADGNTTWPCSLSDAVTTWARDSSAHAPPRDFSFRSTTSLNSIAVQLQLVVSTVLSL